MEKEIKENIKALENFSLALKDLTAICAGNITVGGLQDMLKSEIQHQRNKLKKTNLKGVKHGKRK